MNILPRKSLFLLVSGLVLVGALIGLLVPSPVRAGGAQPILPGGGSLQPDGETAIQMTSDVVTFNIQQAAEADNTLVPLSPNFYGFQRQPVWFTAVADVVADFTLMNPTSQPVSMTVWYPLASVLDVVEWKLSPVERLPRIQDFEAYIDGDPSNVMVSELTNPKGADRPDLPWANFPVTFPAGKETVIQIRTRLPLQPSVSGIEMTLYNVFHTAALWAGPIGQAELILNLPYPASTETLAGIPSGSLRVPPYYRPSKRADLPAGAVLEGNQARWTWKDLEPGPQDDFVLWLLQPGKWQELENARAATQANPEDGQAWLNLASTYYSLSSNGPGFPTVFGSIYLPLGVKACQEAADLLPERPAPHAGLALLTLEQYMADKNAPPEVLQYVQDEFQIASDLEARTPSMAKETGRTRWFLTSLKSELDSYFTDDAAATAEWAAWSTHWAEKSTAAALLETASATPTRKPTVSATPVPSTTPPPPTATPHTTAEPTGNGQGQVILVAAGVIGLVVVGYLALKRLRKSVRK